MKVKAFEISATRTIPLQTSVTTLDEMTRTLPQGFYTTFSTSAQGTRVLGLRDHLQRLYVPAGEVKLNPAVDEYVLRERIALLAKENLPNESRVRLILAKESGKIYIGVLPFMSLSKNVYANGAHVITSSVARHDPRIKDTGFISESVAQRKLLNKDVFEVLLTKNKNIFEGMTSNFYAVKGKTLITAQRGILLGVTRKAMLRIARGQGMGIEYRAPGMNEEFDEAFLTSSSRGVVPIVSINDKAVGQGQVGEWSKILMKGYWDYVEKFSSSLLE